MNRRDALRAIGVLAAGILVPKARDADKDARIAELEVMLDTEEERADGWEQGYMDLLTDYRKLECWYHEKCHELEIQRRQNAFPNREPLPPGPNKIVWSIGDEFTDGHTIGTLAELLGGDLKGEQ